MGTVHRAVLFATALLGVACARVVNLSDPAGPRFDGQYAPAAAAAPAGPAIVVATFNLKLARRPDRAIEVIRATPALRDADVLAMQELDDHAADTLARALGLNYVYYPGAIHPTDQKLFGPAVLSRWPIDSAWKLVLPHESNVRRQRRTVTAAMVRVRGVPVRVYAVHLEIPTRASRADREDQVDAVLADAAGAPEPVIIAGDFNSWSIGEYLSARGFAWPTRDVGATVMAFGWDHIFARGLAPAADGAGVVRDARGASDHKPVWAGLTVAGAPATGASSAP